MFLGLRPVGSGKLFYLSCCKASNIVSLTAAFPEKGVVGMEITRTIMFGVLMLFLAPGESLAQAISEYGRTVGGVGQRQGRASPKASRPSQNARGNTVVQGVGDTGGRPIPSGLVVVSRQTGLYPRQDDTAEKITELSEGDTLIPMIQSNGGSDWYMVKTQQGVVGWVKAVEVQEDTAK
jgi:hypothetical protein